MEIREVDVHDGAQLRAWYDAQESAISHDRAYAVSRTIDALVTQVTVPSDYYEPVLLVAENHAMYATNRAFGYRPVERMHEVQVKD